MKVTIETKERAVSVQGTETQTLFSIVIDALRGTGLTAAEITVGLGLNLENKNK
jgi:hypothetical protein